MLTSHFVTVMLAPLPNQTLANSLGKAVVGSLSIWAESTHICDQHGVPGHWPWPGPALDIVVKWEVSKLFEYLHFVSPYFSVTLFFKCINKYYIKKKCSHIVIRIRRMLYGKHMKSLPKSLNYVKLICDSLQYVNNYGIYNLLIINMRWQFIS